MTSVFAFSFRMRIVVSVLLVVLALTCVKCGPTLMDEKDSSKEGDRPRRARFKIMPVAPEQIALSENPERTSPDDKPLTKLPSKPSATRLLGGNPVKKKRGTIIFKTFS